MAADWRCGWCNTGWDPNDSYCRRQNDSYCRRPDCYEVGLQQWYTQNQGHLNGLGVAILMVNKANGWNVMRHFDWERRECDYKIPASLALLHSEVSEALEAFRKDDREGFDEELADIQIRLLDLATGLGVDMDTVVAAKLEKNRGRGYRHGGKRV